MGHTDMSAFKVGDLDLKGLSGTLIRQRYIILAAVLAAAAVSLVYSSVITPIFASGSRILVDTKPPRIIKVDNQILPEYADSVNYFNSQVEVLKSRSIAEMVFRDLGGYESWDRRGVPADELKPFTRAQRLDSLLSRIRITPVRQTQVIHIDVEDPDPVLAARIADSWTRAYVLFSSTDQLFQRRMELDADLRQQQKYFKAMHPVITALKGEIESIDRTIDLERRRLRLGEDALSAQGNTANVRILDRAQIPLKPVRPGKARNLVLAMILGLLFGCACAFFMESSDRIIMAPDDIIRGTSRRLLAALPRFRRGKIRPGSQLKFQTARGTRIFMAEAFRGLRTAVLYSDADRLPQTIAVASCLRTEGRSMVAVNLAAVCARFGERVILIDMDLHEPCLHALFSLEQAGGLKDVILSPDADPAEFIRKTDIAGLDLLTSGAGPFDSLEVPGSRKMAELIMRLAKVYDRIIFDTPPLMSTADAVVLSKQVDTTLLVAGAGKVRQQALLRGIAILESVHAHIAGCVLNMADAGTLAEEYYLDRRQYVRIDHAGLGKTGSAGGSAVVAL